jgi:ATP-dependent RNA helicase RhlE
MSFEQLGLTAELLRAIREQGYTEPTPIQNKAIPLILQGRDIMAGAQTGTGKTAGFTLPLLQRLGNERLDNPPRAIRALVLTPTRELAAQVAASIETYGRHLPHRAAVIFGGVKINPQIEKLRRGVDILVATPGRLLDHARQKTIDLSRVEFLILDEADRMLDMGFIHDIRKILALLPERGQRQNLMFSATFSEEIRRLGNQLLNQPELVEVAPRNTTVELIEQVAHPVDKNRKRELLSHMIGSRNWRQVLVFTRTKHGANRLARQLEQDGLEATAIHGNKSQAARTRALADFKNGAVRVLVATDIAARGLDIDQLPHVVNYELPNVPEDYIHRIGRTGRAGREGAAVSLVSGEEQSLLRDIERLIGRAVPREVLAGYETGSGPARAEPAERRAPARREASNSRGRQSTRRDGQQNGQQNGQRNGQQNGQRNGQQNGQQNGQRNGQRSGQQNGQQNGQRNGQRNGQQNGQQSGQQSGQQYGQQYGQQRRAASSPGRNASRAGYSSLGDRMFADRDVD